MVGILDSEIFLNFGKIIIILVILTPFIYFITRWYAKFHMSSTGFRIKDRFVLGSNRTLYVVEWEGHLYLLAVTSQQINLIDKMQPTKTDKIDIQDESKGGE